MAWTLSSAEILTIPRAPGPERKRSGAAERRPQHRSQAARWLRGSKRSANTCAVLVCGSLAPWLPGCLLIGFENVRVHPWPAIGKRLEPSTIPLPCCDATAGCTP